MQRLVTATLFLFMVLVSATTQANAETPVLDKPANKAVAAAKTADDDTKKDADKSDESKDKSDDAKSDEKPSKDESAESEADAEEKSDDAKKADTKSEKSKKEDKKKAKPHKVKAEKLEIEVKLSGVFVADNVEEVALRPEVWTRFKVLEAVAHGTTVKQGDVLVRFDDEDLEKDLAKEALEQSIGQLSLMQEEEEFPRIKRLIELNFETTKRRLEQTKADYEYYFATDRPLTVKLAHFRYKSSQEQLAAAQEELKQLQQMYDADEITEETEEIVLRRQKFAVEQAELVLSINKQNRDYTLNVSLPRADKRIETSLEESEIAFKQAKTAYEKGMTRKSYDMEKKRNARSKSIERHGKLLNDKALMVLRAPCDGVVYYGTTKKGKWSQVAALSAKLKPFGSATVNTVLMTIVKPGSLHIESSLSEKDLPSVQAGMKTTVLPAADKELELQGEVASVASVPDSGNKFQVKLDAELAEAPEWLVAGMTCECKILTYENDKAVVIPQSMVQTDEDDEKTQYVMIVTDEEDKPARRNVKLGRKKDKIVEVLKGLEEGDEIVKEEKKDDK